MNYKFAPAERPSVAIAGSEQRFAVHRIYCVGRNYAAHAREMGFDPDREPPFFFSKPADAVVADSTDIPYPLSTDDLHHEVELVVAIGQGGTRISRSDAARCIFGYAVGNDLTRRDLQHAAREEGRPWDTSKGFDRSAPVGAIHPAGDAHPPTEGSIWLQVNKQERQRGDLAEMIWSIPEVIEQISTFFELQPGDLIFTGSPAGVASLQPGDTMVAGIDGLGTLTNRIV